MGLEEKINCLNKNEEIAHDLEEENRKLRVNNICSKCFIQKNFQKRRLWTRNKSKYLFFSKKTSLWRKSTAKTLSVKSSYKYIILFNIFFKKYENLIKNKENQQKKELESLKENLFLIESRYKKSLDMKIQENELLITTLYDLRIKFEPFVNMPNVLRDRNNNVLKC